MIKRSTLIITHSTYFHGPGPQRVLSIGTNSVGLFRAELAGFFSLFRLRRNDIAAMNANTETQQDRTY